MIGEFILTSKDGTLYVLLNDHGTRKVWEFVESFYDASTFKSTSDIDRRTVEHRCPISMYAVRDHGKALSDYLARRVNLG